MSAVTNLRWVEVDESEVYDARKTCVVACQRQYGTDSYFKLQASVLTEAGVHWFDVLIEWNP